MDAPLTLACGLKVEERLARKAGARTALVGLGASRLPEGWLVSFGFAGALDERLRPGTLVTATKVVDVSGETVWEGKPISVAGAEPVVVCGADGVADVPRAREMIAEITGADAIDMESANLARTGHLAGVVRAISDTTERPLGKLSRAATRNGGTDWRVVATAFTTEPVRSIRTARDAREAMRALHRAAEALS